MKKKISVLLIGSLIAISLVGCSSGNDTSSAPSAETPSSDISAQSSVESTAQDNSTSSESSVNTSDSSAKVSDSTSQSDTSSSGEQTELSGGDASSNEVSQPEISVSTEESEIIGPEEGDIVVDEDGNEYVYHESDIIVENPDDEESMEVTSDGSEALPRLLDVTYTPINGKDANIDANAIDMSKLVYYHISNTDELKQFVADYDKTYSLNDVESGVSFNDLAEKFDDNYFEYMSLVVIPAKYDKDTETEIGTITIKDNNYIIEVCTQPPASADKTDCLCFVVQVNNSELGDNQIVLSVVSESMIVTGEDGENDI